MTLILTNPDGSIEQVTSESFREIIREELKPKEPEVKHAPVTIAYAAGDLSVDRKTIKAMAKRGELEMISGKISFESLHEYKIKNEQSNKL